jgi:hypothetical protein
MERDHLNKWRKWEDNIKTDLQEIRWKCMDWITLAHEGIVGGRL